MNRMTDRRRILFAATTAAAMAAGAVSARSADIQGTIAYEGGSEIPKGRIAIMVGGAAPQAASRAQDQQDRLKSDGGTKVIEFSLAAPSAAMAEGQEIVVQLERDDGWLLARGSAIYKPDAPVQIILYTVMY